MKFDLLTPTLRNVYEIPPNNVYLCKKKHRRFTYLQLNFKIQLSKLLGEDRM
jgi:hypothetical protein